MLFLGLPIVFLHLLTPIYTAESCKTPNGQDGVCKVMHECEPLDTILRNRPILATQVQYLQKSICGFDNVVPKVCCPAGTTIQEGRRMSKITDLLPTNDACGIFIEEKIVGGEETGIGEHPWAALLQYRYGNNKITTACGGVLINNKYVLTAAHCIKRLPSDWKLINVILGEHNTQTDVDCKDDICAPKALKLQVEEEIVHESYIPNELSQHNDIALLRLKQSVKYTDFIKPICLPRIPELRNKTYTGNQFFVVGWGLDENRIASPVKRRVQLPIVNNTQCASVYRSASVTLEEGQICAGGEAGHDSCRGDSGGPLMTVYKDKNREINWYAVGIVSIGRRDCGTKNWPGVYTKVTKYIDWIVGKLRP